MSSFRAPSRFSLSLFIKNQTRPEYGLRQFVECFRAFALNENLAWRKIAVTCLEGSTFKDDNEIEIPHVFHLFTMSCSERASRGEETTIIIKECCVCSTFVVDGYEVLCGSSMWVSNGKKFGCFLNFVYRRNKKFRSIH